MNKLRALFSAILIIAVLACTPGDASEKRTKTILLVNSYHKRYFWTDELTRGVEEAVSSSGKKIDLQVDYMDTKRQFSQEYLSLLADMFHAKHKVRHYDVVIFADNNAFDFAIKYGRGIFGDTPFVFCGVNYMSPESLVGFKNITGIVEETDIEANLDLIKKFHPKRKKITVVTDNSPTGLKIQEEIRRLARNRKDQLKINLLYDVTGDELVENIKKLDEDDAVIYTFFFRDKNDIFYEFDKGATMVCQNSKAPVYVLWDFCFGYGTVGGNITTGHMQGMRATQQALEILSGKAAKDVPIQYIKGDTFRFDYRAMTRFDIKPDQLPEGSEILFMPLPFYKVHKNLIWQAALLFLFLVLAMVGLGLGLWRSRTAEAKMCRKEEDLRATLHSINDGVITTDTMGSITRMNRVAEELTGWPQKEAQGYHINKIWNVKNSNAEAPTQIEIDDILKTGELSKEFNGAILSSRDGKEIMIAASAAPINNDSGQTTGVVFVVRDITQNYMLQEQLKHSQKMEAVGQLAGGVAHDFNNMIGGIMGSAEILQSYISDDPKARKFHQIILETSERAAELIDKLLAFSRKQVIGSSVVDIHETIENTMALLRSTIDKRIEIDLRLEAERYGVVSDPSSIQSAILNLGINASHAMPEGGTLSIVSSNTILDDNYCTLSSFELMPGEYLQIEIRDTGHGIPPEHLSHIFEPFFTTKEAGRGTGLGLAAVYGSVQQHKGCITVYSEVGKGTSFNIYLPLAKQHAIPISKESLSLIHGSGRILVIDDEEVMRSVANAILTDLGYDVVLTCDGQQGIDVFSQKSEDFDMVILDMVMPRMNGRDCFRELKKIKPDVKVILSSGFSREEDVRQMKEMGLCGFIRKPFRSHVLSKIVHETINDNQDG
ncbi:MAG: response regulator [Planctomycetes bacterium]|nr:response regulator [Planctomycetota bacterium]